MYIRSRTDESARDDLARNAFSNRLKHSGGPETATISELEVVVMIARAIQKFVATYEATRPEFEEFSVWAVDHGHTPRLLTVKATKGA